ncbi:MAG: DUF3526 domain-containing protein [Acidobacteria bacterium]|nr:DUF3526 domain-containing protein [Acidobacteriota bacterium]
MTSAATVWMLLGYEWRRVLRAPIVWMALGLLLTAGAAGALNAARLHANQTADIARMAEQEGTWYADVRVRAARYAQPSSTPVPYWQDPTGASGFSRYYLRRFAAKPHLPLSMLAVGQSDLQPFAVPLRLETLFGGDRVYDYQPPRALATGLFDFSFVLVFVLPLCIGVVVAVVGAHERDQDVLSLVAAQPLTPRRWWSARLIALALVLAPGVAVVTVIALVVAGAPVLGDGRETLAVAALVAAHTLLWLALGGACLARGQGAIATASVITGVWLCLTAGVPLAGSLAVRLVAGPPTAVADVNELRRTTDDVQSGADAVVARRLVAHLGPTAASIDPGSLDYSTRLVLITEELEERLASQERRRQAYARTSAGIAAIVGWLSPQVAVQTALADLAGTGTSRHQRFLSAVRDFQLELRTFMNPRVLAPVRSPVRPACNGCPGRLTFTDYDAIPRFTLQDVSADARSAAALVTAAWLGVLALVVATWGIGGGTSWHLGS